MRLDRALVPVLAWLALPAAAAPPPTTQPEDLDAKRQRWNRVYQADEPEFNTAPNAFLKRCLSRIEGRGRALDLAMGQGRNALLLARHGYETTGIDISNEGLSQARAAAEKAGLSLHTVQADVFAFDYGRERWDLISVIYFNPAKPILPTLKGAVKPGGYIVIEGFGPRKVGGPPDDSKFRRNELLEVFSDWHVLEYQDGDFPADWGGEPTAHVVWLLARRPTAER